MDWLLPRFTQRLNQKSPAVLSISHPSHDQEKWEHTLLMLDALSNNCAK